ncbi:MAG TPA: succinate dehydrogenase flavoprotein subunit [Chloroflexota bacterium]|nr:succinate dehydrogenase flavoprotein subunit [Chloroflexota bacterium]
MNGVTVHHFDAIIVGAGGAGLMAALQTSALANVAVLSKLYPTRSHTGSAQGGIGAALGNLEEDHWVWHMFDTVKGGDYLSDQDAVEILCRDAIETVYELEHRGLPFNRTPEGKIDQRRFGGHTRNFGEAPVRRACYAADRTGHMILQTLYQQCIKAQVNFYNEFHVLDLLLSEGRAAGVVAREIESGDLHVFQSKAVIIATGGYGRAFRVTSNALAGTGDGVAMAYHAGIPLEDVEFYQFHPTGMYRMGILITEGARGEGAILLNGQGERFMERYAPTLKDLAPRDLTSRCIYTEIREGRGINGQDYVYLDLTHLGRDVVETKLPDITEFVRVYFGIDPVVAPIPVQPTAHYAMGGIPTDLDGRVVIDEKNTPLPGLYAAGECACVSVHGANRLGTNSLVDLIVFGRRAGIDALRYSHASELPPLPADAADRARAEIEHFLTGESAEPVSAVREELRTTMMDLASVLRTGEGLTECLSRIGQLRERYRRTRPGDRGRTFNTDLQETLEVGNLIDISEVLVTSALARTESRGAHYREDYPQRNDQEWLKHTLAYQRDGKIELRYKPVSITRFEPKARTY